MNRTRIGILVPNFSEFTGDARVAEIQALDMLNEGKEVTIFSFTSDIQLKDAKLDTMGMPASLFLQRIYRLLFPLDIFQTMRYLPRLGQCDELIAHLYPMTWLGYLTKKRYGTRYTFWYHGITPPELYPHKIEQIYVKIQIFLTKHTIKNADRIVSVSDSAQKELKRYTGFESEVVYNKPNVKRFYKGIDGSSIRKRYNLGNNPVFLNVGVLNPIKGAHLLIDSFKLIRKELPDAKLVLVGKQTYGYYLEDLKKKSDDSIIFAGYVPDEELPMYYSMADVYVTCSMWETYNLPVHEAQESGKPVIAFDYDFFKNEVNKNGILVDKKNIEQFADAAVSKFREIRSNI